MKKVKKVGTNRITALVKTLLKDFGCVNLRVRPGHLREFPPVWEAEARRNLSGVETTGGVFELRIVESGESAEEVLALLLKSSRSNRPFKTLGKFASQSRDGRRNRSLLLSAADALKTKET